MERMNRFIQSNESNHRAVCLLVRQEKAPGTNIGTGFGHGFDDYGPRQDRKGLENFLMGSSSKA